MAALHARLAAQFGKVLVLGAVLRAHNELAVGEVVHVGALDRHLALQHRDVDGRLVGHVLVLRPANVHTAV